MVKSTQLSVAALLAALIPVTTALAQPAKPAPSARRGPAKVSPAAAADTAKPAPAAPAPAKPTPDEALKFQPSQPQIECDVPDPQAVAQCTLTLLKAPPVSGWEVRMGDGTLLRRFLDTNSDNRIDQWCYYKDGVEVYRDVDSDFDRKVDEYRWLGTAGTRWAVDTNQDGRIDRWKTISPEEVSEELVVALSTRDTDRFRLLLLAESELQGLRLGAEQSTELGKKIADTLGGLDEFLRTQEFVKPDARWVNFGSTRPGIVPAGTAGSEQDLQVYENAVAVVESGDGHDQVVVGTLVRSGDAWRIIGLPRSISDSQAAAGSDGFFFRGPLAQQGATDTPVAGGLTPEIQKLISTLEQLDRDLLAAKTPEAIAPLNAQKVDVLQKLADLATTPEDKSTWVRQLADTISSTLQVGGMPDGIQRLDAIFQKLQGENAAPELVAYVKFLFLSADYGQAMQRPGADSDYAVIQQKWLTDLEQFVTDFSGTEESADAMLQLAFAEEISGQDEKAVNWYTRITTEFPDTPRSTKATGAKRRLESVGQVLTLEGKDLQGNPVSVAALRGKVVLIHYWATWSVQCLTDISVLKDMQTKYGKDNVAVLGVNVDNSDEDFQAYIQGNPIPWPQMHEPGGLDSLPATTLGVMTLPTTLLLDKEGKVVSRNLRGADVDASLRNLLR